MLWMMPRFLLVKIIFSYNPRVIFEVSNTQSKLVHQKMQVSLGKLTAEVTTSCWFCSDLRIVHSKLHSEQKWRKFYFKRDWVLTKLESIVFSF
jgi:hypothetical protein